MIKFIFLLSSLLFSFSSYAMSEKNIEKSLYLYNIHTEEELKITYRRDGKYIQDSLNKLNHFLRDFRTQEKVKIDPELFDALHLIYSYYNGNSPISIISGYRSSKTNNMLRKNGSGVAKLSNHTLGKAIDIRIPYFSTKKIRDIAIKNKIGGVGYYQESNFVHIDTGKVRFW